MDVPICGGEQIRQCPLQRSHAFGLGRLVDSGTLLLGESHFKTTVLVILCSHTPVVRLLYGHDWCVRDVDCDGHVGSFAWSVRCTGAQRAGSLNIPCVRFAYPAEPAYVVPAPEPVFHCSSSSRAMNI